MSIQPLKTRPSENACRHCGDDHRVLGGELSALVDETDDRLREDDREQTRGDEQERDWRNPPSSVRRSPAASPRAARRASIGKRTVVTATAKMPCGSMYSRKALSIAAGASSGSRSRDAKSVSTRKFTLTSPMVRVTGSISASTRRTAGSRQSMTIVRLPSSRRSHGIGNSTWTSVPRTTTPA